MILDKIIPSDRMSRNIQVSDQTPDWSVNRPCTIPGLSSRVRNLSPSELECGPLSSGDGRYSDTRLLDW